MDFRVGYSMYTGNNFSKNVNSSYDFAKMGRIRETVVREKENEKINERKSAGYEGRPFREHYFFSQGVDVTDNPNAHKVIVPISEEMKREIEKNVQAGYERQGHYPKEDISNVEKMHKLKNEYIANIKKEDRPKTSWSIYQYRHKVSEKYEALIRERDPEWDWGKKVKPEVLKQVFGGGLDISI